MVSKWLIHTCWCVGQVAAEQDARADRPSRLGAPVLAPAGLRHLAAELRATSWAP